MGVCVGEYHLTIKERPAGERPRERLLAHGPASLSNAELLAILLRTGRRGETAVDLANRLLVEYDGLIGLTRQAPADLTTLAGIGPAKACELLACLELGRRLVRARGDARAVVASPEDVAALLVDEMSDLDHEQLRVVLLTTKNTVIRVVTVYQGSVNSAQVRIGELFKEAVRQNSPSLVIVHNHPSGDPTPSPEDARLTAEIVRAGRLLDIQVYDHIVIGGGRHVSLRRLGLGWS